MKKIQLHDFTPLCNQEMKSIIGGEIKTRFCGCTLYKSTNSGLQTITVTDEDLSDVHNSTNVEDCLMECSSLCNSVTLCSTYDFIFTASGSKY